MNITTAGVDLAKNLFQVLHGVDERGKAVLRKGEPGDFRRPDQGVEAVRAKALALPFRHYSEILNNLVIPPEEPVIGDIVDDLVDIYFDIAPGLALFESGDREGARNHWRFWLSSHWGEHATSAIRALWSYLARRQGSDE